MGRTSELTRGEVCMSYPQVTVDDREPPQLVDELAELGYEVEVKRLTKGDFEGTTTIGEIKPGEDFFSSIVDKFAFIKNIFI